MTKLFLREHYNAALEEIKTTESRAREATQSIAEAASSGNGWHDNPEFDEAQRQSSLWTNQLSQLRNFISGATIVDSAPKNDGSVRFGREVTVKEETSGKEEIYVISSFYIPTSLDRKNLISHASPLAEILMGSKEGETKIGAIAGKTKKFTIVKIN